MEEIIEHVETRPGMAVVARMQEEDDIAEENPKELVPTTTHSRLRPIAMTVVAIAVIVLLALFVTMPRQSEPQKPAEPVVCKGYVHDKSVRVSSNNTTYLIEVACGTVFKSFPVTHDQYNLTKVNYTTVVVTDGKVTELVTHGTRQDGGCGNGVIMAGIVVVGTVVHRRRIRE